MSEPANNPNTLKTITAVVTGSIMLACVAKSFVNMYYLAPPKRQQPQSPSPKSTSNSSSHDTSFAMGLNWVDLDRTGDIRVNAYNQADLKREVVVDPKSSGGAAVYSVDSPWLSICSKDRDLQFGTFSTEGKNPPWSTQINFERTYASPPNVVVWFQEFDFDNTHNWRLQTSAESITATGFTLKLSTWGDSKLNKAAVTWIAHPANRSNIMSGTFDTRELRPWNQPKLDNKKEVKFEKPFERTPRVFCGLNLFDIDSHQNLRLKTYSRDVTVQGMTMNLDSWLNTTHYASRADWIAIQDF